MKPGGVLKFSGIGKSVESMSEPQSTADSGAALNGPLADSGALNGDCTSGPFIIGAGGLRKESLNKIGVYWYRKISWGKILLGECVSEITEKEEQKLFVVVVFLKSFTRCLKGQ